jgi:hypothetical protein
MRKSRVTIDGGCIVCRNRGNSSSPMLKIADRARLSRGHWRDIAVATKTYSPGIKALDDRHWSIHQLQNLGQLQGSAIFSATYVHCMRANKRQICCGRASQNLARKSTNPSSASHKIPPKPLLEIESLRNDTIYGCSHRNGTPPVERLAEVFGLTACMDVRVFSRDNEKGAQGRIAA